MDIASTIQTLSIAAMPVVLAITLHEAAHGYAARHFGDPTAWLAGRISLNPLRHIEWFGTILLPILLFLINSPFLFGWAKPVPVDFGRLRHPKRDMLWVAAAGPAVNLLMALGWALLLKFDTLIPFNSYSRPLALMCEVGIGINIALMVLNLIPLPPLDGSKVLMSFLPPRLSYKLAGLERYSFFILIALMMTPVLGGILVPLQRLILSIFNLMIGVIF